MSSKKGVLGKNIAYMMFYHIFTAITPLIVTPYISRVLGAVEIGKYTYAYSIAYYFVMVANLGINAHGSRRIAEVKNDPEKLNQTFSNLFWLHFSVAGIVAVSYLISLAFGLNRENAALSYIMVFYVLSSVVDVKWFFYGLESFKTTVLRNVIIKVIYVVLIFAFVKNRNDVKAYAFIMAFVGFFLCELSLFFLVFRKIKLQKPQFGRMMSDFTPLLLLFIPSVANIMLRHFDKIMLGMMSSYEQLGFYENTDRILVILSLLTTSVGDVMLPRVSNMIASDDADSANRLFTTVLRVTIMVSCALAFGLMAVAKDFVPVFFGDGFNGCIALLTWIAPTLIMLNLSVSIRKQYLIPHHLEKVYITATVSSLVINIAANAVLIPIYGALGAVYGTLVAELSVVLIQFIMVRDKLNYGIFFGETIKYSAIGFLMFLSVRLVAGLPIYGVFGLLLEIVTGAVVFLLLVWICMMATKDELLRYVKKVIKRKS